MSDIRHSQNSAILTRFLPNGRGVAGQLDGSLRFPDVGLCLDSEMTYTDNWLIDIFTTFQELSILCLNSSYLPTCMKKKGLSRV